jgi:hypothetical protein
VGEAEDVLRAQHLMTHGDRRVPERIEERGGELGRGLGVDDRSVDDEDHVRVAPQRHRAAPEAPRLRQRDAARHPGVTRCSFEEQLEARGEEARVRFAERETVFAALEPREQARPVTFQRVAEHRRIERGWCNATGR